MPDAIAVRDDIRMSLGRDLCALLDKDGWTDIMVNADGRVFVDDGHVHEVSGIRFDPWGLVGAARTLADWSRQSINPTSPTVCSVIPVMALRVIFKIPPVVSSPTAVFRRPSPRIIALDELVKGGLLGVKAARYLSDSVEAARNILLAGGTGSGKTTLLNSLMAFLPASQRPYIIEDVNEIACSNANFEHVLVNRDYGYRQAVHDALRSYPDRIVVGECLEGHQTLEMLKAWNTGHSGGMTTIHATDAHNALRRLAQLCSEVAVASQEQLIRDAVDVVVYMRKVDGVRRVTQIYDVKQDKEVTCDE